MMGRSPKYYIHVHVPSFVEIGLPVLENKIFEGFLPYMGMAVHLGHVTSTMFINFHFLVPESLHTKFASEWHSSCLENLV